MLQQGNALRMLLLFVFLLFSKKSLCTNANSPPPTTPPPTTPTAQSQSSDNNTRNCDVPCDPVRGICANNKCHCRIEYGGPGCTQSFASLLGKTYTGYTAFSISLAAAILLLSLSLLIETFRQGFATEVTQKAALSMICVGASLRIVFHVLLLNGERDKSPSLFYALGLIYGGAIGAAWYLQLIFWGELYRSIMTQSKINLKRARAIFVAIAIVLFCVPFLALTARESAIPVFIAIESTIAIGGGIAFLIFASTTLRFVKKSICSIQGPSSHGVFVLCTQLLMGGAILIMLSIIGVVLSYVLLDASNRPRTFIIVATLYRTLEFFSIGVVIFNYGINLRSAAKLKEKLLRATNNSAAAAPQTGNINTEIDNTINDQDSNSVDSIS